MAFNFNWSPLIADTSRAREMLTTALNKSPKPPIIVDDIIVTELNLGSVPPELEIVEIGDLAEDKFRGIFKLTYAGDAFLTLKTRVQANPLNTYLSTKPSFASPQPLAAASGLTIPLQIMLSDIRLSSFVILVFSKQKGITLVFRNDPLEGLKVSSTFDSIPFVRDYLQKEIEGQLRVLFMEDLPAIIHRLSLRLWSPEHQDEDENVVQEHPNETTQNTEKPINPLASPPLNPFDAFGRPLDEYDLASLSPDPQSASHATFSQKNLLRLATLTDSHRTLSLFTPPVQDAVYRAWSGVLEREKTTGPISSAFTLASLNRRNSMASSAAGSLQSFSDASPVSALPSRGSMSGLSSMYAASNTVSSRSRTHNGRKRKTRVINLRKPKEDSSAEHKAEAGSRPTTPTSTAPSSENVSGSMEREGELVTPPDSPQNSIDKTPMPRKNHSLEVVSPQPQLPPTVRKLQNVTLDTAVQKGASASSQLLESPVEGMSFGQHSKASHAEESQHASSLPDEKSHSSAAAVSSPSSGTILEPAWMVKMANEIAKRVQEEKERNAEDTSSKIPGSTRRQSSESGMYGRRGSNAWGSEEIDETPPPAYAA